MLSRWSAARISSQPVAGSGKAHHGAPSRSVQRDGQVQREQGQSGEQRRAHGDEERVGAERDQPDAADGQQDQSRERRHRGHVVLGVEEAALQEPAQDVPRLRRGDDAGPGLRGREHGGHREDESQRLHDRDERDRHAESPADGAQPRDDHDHRHGRQDPPEVGEQRDEARGGEDDRHRGDDRVGDPGALAHERPAAHLDAPAARGAMRPQATSIGVDRDHSETRQPWARR